MKSSNLNANGYIKFENGLMLQWGAISSTGQSRYVYMPDTFIDLGYKVFFGIKQGDSDAVIALYINNKSKSSFYVTGKFYNPVTNSSGYPGEQFDWFALGSWK